MFSAGFQRVGTISYKYVIQLYICKRCLNLFLQHVVTRIMFLKRLSVLMWLFLLIPTVTVLSAQPLYVGEFNIRNDNAKDAAAGNGWAVRCPVVCDILKVESFDIFGTQEVLHNQLEDMLAALPDYDYVGVGRNDGKTSGEYAAIFYKEDRVKCL